MGFRYRRLPHLHALGEPHFVTFRLAGSLPEGRYFRSGEMSSGEAFVQMDNLLDHEACGPLYLKRPDVAGIVADAIREPREWDLHEWVVMANHVHLLVTPWIELSELMRQIKGATARAANVALGRSGTFWQHESYDRLVRSSEEFRRIERYIQINPVKAGLVACPEAFRWSSGFGRRG